MVRYTLLTTTSTTTTTSDWATAEMVKPWTRSEDSRILLAHSLALAGAYALLAGCSHSGMSIAPVHGKVTYKGGPVAGATVEFLCTGASRPAAGTTDEQGNYRLTTFTAGDGAMIGTHVVTVNVYASEAESSLPSVARMDSKERSKPI